MLATGSNSKVSVSSRAYAAYLVVWLVDLEPAGIWCVSAVSPPSMRCRFPDHRPPLDRSRVHIVLSRHWSRLKSADKVFYVAQVLRRIRISLCEKMPTNGVDPRVLHNEVWFLLLRRLEPLAVSDCAARYRSYCAAGFLFQTVSVARFVPRLVPAVTCDGYFRGKKTRKKNQQRTLELSNSPPFPVNI